MSDAAVAVSLPAWGASVEAAISAVRPCCHAGAAGAGAGAGVAVGVAAEIRGVAGGGVCAQPDKTLIATSALKMALLFIMESFC